MAGATGVVRTARSRGVWKASAVLLILGALAAGSLWLTLGTARNYQAATLAAARFRVSVNQLVCEGFGGPRRVAKVEIGFANGSGWPLSVTSMRVVMYLDGNYIWGQSFDWLNDPIRLPPGEVRDIELEIEVPDTRTDLLARSGEEWIVRTSGLVEMPMLGNRLYKTIGSFPAKEVYR